MPTEQLCALSRDRFSDILLPLYSHRRTLRIIEPARLQAPVVQPARRFVVTGHSAQSYRRAHQRMLSALVTQLHLSPTASVAISYGEQPGALCGVRQDIAAFAGRTDRTAEEVMTTYSMNHARHMADLMDLLSCTPEGDHAMLDRTLILWVSSGPLILGGWTPLS